MYTVIAVLLLHSRRRSIQLDIGDSVTASVQYQTLYTHVDVLTDTSPNGRAQRHSIHVALVLDIWAPRLSDEQTVLSDTWLHALLRSICCAGCLWQQRKCLRAEAERYR